MLSTKDKIVIRGKQRARRLALQALYQWHMSGTDLVKIDAEFRSMNNMARVDGDYFAELLYGIEKQRMALEDAFVPFLDRTVVELNPIELTVLWIGSFELIHHLEVPYRVVLDEAIKITKEYGSEDGHRYVNGVLHQLATQVRAIEMRCDS